MDVGVSTSLSRVDGLNGDGVGDSSGDRDQHKLRMEDNH
jgi:hypothetical protein